MLRSLKLGNFRAYKSASFQFTDLNIFMGPNNSGKSSAISAINLLAQTISNIRTDQGTLILNGEYDDLGSYIDVVHGNHAASPLSLKFSYGRADVDLEFKYRSVRRQIELRSFDLSNSGEALFSYRKKKDSVDIVAGGYKLDSSLGKYFPKEPSFSGFWPSMQIRPSRMREDEEEVPIHVSHMERAIRGLHHNGWQLRSTFGIFDSLGPFRERPQRTYTYSGEVADRIGRSGSNGITLLTNNYHSRSKNSKELIDGVNTYLQVSGIAKSIKVKPLTRRHYEICLVGFDDKEHNICDVGFGCSQVLPVLTAGLNLKIMASSNRSGRAPIFVVQEPEIHLHPNAQAALGSYFVGLARSGVQSFVETHSDHFVIRVARHIARGDIDPSCVKVFFVEPTKERPKVHKITFDRTGAFKPSWPGDFMSYRKDETMELVRERMLLGAGETDQFSFEYL